MATTTAANKIVVMSAIKYNLFNGFCVLTRLNSEWLWISKVETQNDNGCRVFTYIITNKNIFRWRLEYVDQCTEYRKFSI